MLEFGEAIHLLRTSHKITQASLSKGILDRSSLSKIEHGKLYVSHENAVKLIARLGVTEEEFEYFRSNYSANRKQQLLIRFFTLVDTTEKAKIDALINDCLAEQNDQDIGRIAIILQALQLLGQPHGFSRACELVQPIWFDYLAQVKELTVLDTCLLSVIIFAFDEKTVTEIINRLLWTIDNRFPFLKSLKCNLLTNRGFMQMTQNKFAQAKETLLQALTLAQENANKKLIIKTRLEICSKKKEKAFHYANLMEEIGTKENAAALKREINQFDYLFAKD
ncbi:helix-turn-helix transcriptional regulator [Lactobacillus sp. ESL0791]|uniref:helix-turn-helix domain-containing protein n=1 Tax=Lactobacillus sp. ESL0791 TaxID=2983234 RepID=UPI0023F792BF|nr:helix-turn-helix transcriptional regulator [Lactobacillus sp. ESL0791]MDF7638931.1 helix-turn-helix transcriptional regulator [Lactobacillus sp. ESL0791]